MIRTANCYQDPLAADPWLVRYLALAKPICMAITRRKKHVSYILCKGKVVAVGNNSFKGHPKAVALGYRFGEQHSELNAYLKCNERNKLTLINVRYNAKGELRMARPCALCLPWCTALFDEIYYTGPDGQVRLLDKIEANPYSLLRLQRAS